jgi:hypothetical protein
MSTVMRIVRSFKPSDSGLGFPTALASVDVVELFYTSFSGDVDDFSGWE